MILLTAAASSGMYRDTTVITTVHLILVAVLAGVVVIGLAWGMRQKRLRSAGERQEAERNEALAAHPPAATAEGMQSQVQSQRTVAEPEPTPLHTPVPTAPAPPPLGDMGLGAPAAAAVVAEAADYRLTDIKGLGPKAVPLLAEQGVTSVAELAALDDAQAAAIDAGLGALSGRLVRDRWVEQARLLAAGDRAGFEATFGKL